MNNLVLCVDGSRNDEKNCDYFNTLQKEFLIHSLSLEKAATIQAALLAFLKQDYLLVIIMEDYVNYMPQLPIMRELKRTPILIISSVHEAETVIEALNKGADSYIINPNTAQEIFAHSNALIRRYKVFTHEAAEQTAPILTYKDFTLYPEQRKVFASDQKIYLTRKEFDLFQVLLENQGRVLDYEQLFYKVWGENYLEGTTNALAILVSRLRQKLKLDTLKNVHDMGYRLDV